MSTRQWLKISKMTKSERNDLLGALCGLTLLAIPIVSFIFTGVSNEMCKANEEYCSERLLCYYYEKGCEEHPDLVTYREKQIQKVSTHDGLWQRKFQWKLNSDVNERHERGAIG